MQIYPEYSKVSPIRRSGPATNSAQPGVAGQTRALISERAREMLQVQRAMESAPSQQAERVEAIRAQMESGEYRVDLDALARKLAPLFDGES